MYLTYQRRRSLIILLFLALFSLPHLAYADAGNPQETFRTAAYDIAVEGEYVYILGEAVNYQGELNANDLDLSGGMKDILLVKLRTDGTPIFTALIGGGDDDAAYSLAVRQGVVYILGETWSSDFPGAPGNAGENDALLMALAADGSGILWARRFGGSDQDAGRALALDDDALYLAGITWSGDFLPGEDLGDADGFLGRLGLDGGLDWLKIFGGGALDAPFDLAVVSDQIWVVGQSFSRDFGGTHQGEGDAFAARFSLGGEQQFVGMYGGREADIAFAISPDDDGGILLAGGTRSSDLVNALREYSGNYDSFLMTIDDDGELQRTTYFGGTDVEYAYDIELASGGGLFLVGETYSPVFPLGYGQPLESFGNGDAFIVQINPDGDVINSWLKGGVDVDRARAGGLTSEGLWLVGGFSTGDLSYGLLVSPEELGGIILPTAEPILPTATLAPTATQQPTETPLPTSTPTPQPTTPQTATAEALNASTGMAAATTTAEFSEITTTWTVPITESDEGVEMTAVSESVTHTAATSGEERLEDDVAALPSENEGQDGLSTSLLVGGGLLLAAGVGGAFYWVRRNKAKDAPKM